MVEPYRQRRTPRSPAEDLRQAFGHYAEVIGWRWKVRITPIPAHSIQELSLDVAHPVVRLELSRADALALATLLFAAEILSHHRPAIVESDSASSFPLPYLGKGVMDVGEVAHYIGVAPSTIRSWMARGGPKHHPFPDPDIRRPRRNYWHLVTIDRWWIEEAEIEDRARKKQERNRSQKSIRRPRKA